MGAADSIEKSRTPHEQDEQRDQQRNTLSRICHGHFKLET